MELEELKEKAVYHYKSFNECMDAICEIDENEGADLMQYVESIGGC